MNFGFLKYMLMIPWHFLEMVTNLYFFFEQTVNVKSGCVSLAMETQPLYTTVFRPHCLPAR